MSLIGTLEISRKALNAFKTALTVVGHNIANVNTPGYSRQRVDLSPSAPLDELPSGVEVDGIRRVRDLFADLKYREAIAEQGRWEAQRGVFEKIESVIGEMGEGSLLDLFDEFWSAWHDLAELPESTPSRVHLIQTAQALTAKLRWTDSYLAGTIDSIDAMIDEKISRVNDLLEEVAELNSEIAAAIGGEGEAADLQDRRDLALDELSKLIGIGFSPEENGTTTVRIGGVTVVQGGERVWLLAESDGAGLSILTGGGVEVEPAGGEVKGLIELRERISDLLGEVRGIGLELISRVNELHSSGYGLDGSSGVEFFTGADSSDIGVNPDLEGNPELIAAASKPGSPGDNSLALSIASLREGFDSRMKALLAEVGSAAAKVKKMAESSKGAAEMINSLKEGFSGVSLEEELLDLIVYQRAFQAASKVAAAVDELLQTVLNIV